jgi:hypothetical protein
MQSFKKKFSSELGLNPYKLRFNDEHIEELYRIQHAENVILIKTIIFNIKIIFSKKSKHIFGYTL